MQEHWHRHRIGRLLSRCSHTLGILKQYGTSMAKAKVSTLKMLMKTLSNFVNF